MRTHFSNIEYAVSSENALEGASACVISTDWDEFAVLDILPALKREDSSVGGSATDPRRQLAGLCALLWDFRGV